MITLFGTPQRRGLFWWAWRLEGKHDRPYYEIPPWWRRAPAILVHMWHTNSGFRSRYVRLTAAEYLLSWPQSAVRDLIRDRLCQDCHAEGLMFHNGYRLFEFDGEHKRWVMCDGVHK